MDNFLNKLVAGTEAVLTWRARRRWVRKEKQKQKNVILDWVEAFVWAACVVLLVNQYFFQAYEIPSASMEPTLLGHDLPNDVQHDRIFVNKFLFGPELLPGMFKLPGLVTPQRGDIIIFENPDYLNQGPVFDIAQRLIYMMTLSMVDIDRNPDGTPKIHFLIKRGVGYSGDTVRWRNGEPQFQLPGTARWVDEETLKTQLGLRYDQHRNATGVPPQVYALLPGAMKALAAKQVPELDLKPSAADLASLEQYDRLRAEYKFSDTWEEIQQQYKAILAVYPQRADVASAYFRYETGTWVPDGSILPLGDNRDNSKDGRWFGPVPLDKVLGEASFRYWPLGRAGGI